MKENVYDVVNKYVMNEEFADKVLGSLEPYRQYISNTIGEITKLLELTIKMNADLGGCYNILADAAKDILAIKEELNYEKYELFFNNLEAAMEFEDDKSEDDNEIQSE